MNKMQMNNKLANKMNNKMNNTEIMRLEDKFQLKTYKKFPIAIVKGKGCFVWDADGRSFIDFYGGHAVALVGHCNPKVAKAIQEQSRKLIFYSNIAYNDARAKAGELIIKVSPGGIRKVFFCNSGAEANEAALKMARKFTGKDGIISMKNSFHGRTIGALSATGIEKYRLQFGNYGPSGSSGPSGLSDSSHSFAEFGDIESAKKLANSKTAAIIIEPIQSMAGVVMAERDYYRELRDFCTEKGIVLIFDEVQTCFGRTGKMFAAQHFGVAPDIITCAKGMAGGFPMGAALVNGEIAETVSLGEQGTTFGGGPLACAAAKATIEAVLEENLMENAKVIGRYIEKKADEMDGVKEVRGLGLLRGLKFEADASDTSHLPVKLLEKGIIAGTADVDKSVLRLMPPLTIGKKEVNKLFLALKAVL